MFFSMQILQAEFEKFVSGLGWLIDLETHQPPRYRGGLQNNGSTGKNAVYYADTSTEQITNSNTNHYDMNNDNRTRNGRCR